MGNRVIIIWHNVNMSEGRPTGFLHGYADNDAVTPVFVFTDTRDTTPVKLAEHCFHMFNAPPEYLTDKTDAAIANRYRANRLRSLSVGDLVQIDGALFACERAGFKTMFHGVKLNVQPDPFDNFR